MWSLYLEGERFEKFILTLWFLFPPISFQAASWVDFSLHFSVETSKISTLRLFAQ
jgi:hypothetical protein